MLDAVRRGQATGEIASDQDARDVARFLVCQIEGMRLLGKVGATRQEMAAVVDGCDAVPGVIETDLPRHLIGWTSYRVSTNGVNDEVR